MLAAAHHNELIRAAAVSGWKADEDGHQAFQPAAETEREAFGRYRNALSNLTDLVLGES
jgi:hypothetical protein